jgi:hypothetical protein
MLSKNKLTELFIILLSPFLIGGGQSFQNSSRLKTVSRDLVTEFTTIDFEGIAHGGGQANAVNLVGDEFPGITLTPGPGADGLFVGIPDSTISDDNNVNFFAYDFYPTSGVAVFSPDLYPSPGSLAPNGSLFVDFDFPTSSVGAIFLDVEGALSSIEAFDSPGGTGNSLGKMTLQFQPDDSQVFAGVEAAGIRSAILAMGKGEDGVGIDDLCYGCPLNFNVHIDIKPRSCPNPLNTKSRGLLPVTILGTENFDVTDVDVSTVELEGISPVRHAFEDAVAPFYGECIACFTEGPDGFLDLTLKFDTQEVLSVLGKVDDGEERCLKLTGNLNDKREISGEDGVVIRKKGSGPISGKLNTFSQNAVTLFQDTPNPFIQQTAINYKLSAPTHISLKIYDMTGRLVKVLVEESQNAGSYQLTVTKDQLPGSGVYFYRLSSRNGQATTVTLTRKLILIR